MKLMHRSNQAIRSFHLYIRCRFRTCPVVDLLGYVVVKNALSAEQVRIGNEAIDMLEQQGDLTVSSDFLRR